MALKWDEIISIPSRLPILPFKKGVLLPGAIVRIRCSSASSVRLVEQELWGKEPAPLIGVVPAWDPPSLAFPSSSEAVSTPHNGSEVISEGGVNKADGSEGSEDYQKAPLGGLLTDPLQFHNIGAAARALHVSRETESRTGRVVYSVVLEGRCRFSIQNLHSQGPYSFADVLQLDCNLAESQMLEQNSEVQSLAAEFKSTAQSLLAAFEKEQRKVGSTRILLESAPVQRLADLLVSAIESGFDGRLEMLNAVDLRVRLAKANHLIGRHLQLLSILDQKASQSTEKSRVSGKNLLQGSSHGKQGGGVTAAGDDDDDEDDLAGLEKKLEASGMPEAVWKQAHREFKRLRKMPAHSPGYSSTRQYVELLADLPWKKEESVKEEEIDLSSAKKKLDLEHFGLTKVKQRIVEYIAVHKLKPDAMGPVLCFVGPPGVGKTSLASSIASALGRKFVRIALGGVKDEADIRGHRRTYVGSMPGRLIEGIKRAGVSNPVLLLDEIDKTGMDARGDPAAALLEVLDPEQNKAFTDHYLNVPFDLSKVIFVATANRASPIPAPLLDRMEVIELPGYTPEEKQRIAVRHVIPRVMEENGVGSQHLQIPDYIVAKVIQGYTREAGVRSLSRQLAAIARSAAVRVAGLQSGRRLTRQIGRSLSGGGGGGGLGFGVEGAEVEMEVEAIGAKKADVAQAMVQSKPIIVDEALLESILGPPRFEGNEAAERVSTPGVAVGLVWTAVGGEVQFVEASTMAGKGELHLTGQLGEVIKESAQIALTWVRSRAADLLPSPGALSLEARPPPSLMDRKDVHIHFPAGAVPKDGPSAGVTLVVALVSLLARRCVRSDTAMTGELTLRGLVLPVGGVKEKILAAHRCGIRRVILPHKNLKDLLEVPAAILACMEILPAKRVEEVLHEAFEGGCPVKTSSKL